MSALTRCTLPQPRPAASRQGFALVMIAATLALAFGLAQLRLRFAVDDLRRQTSRLQSQKLDLHSQINALRSEVEARKNGDRLISAAAADFGMVASAPTQWETLQVTDYMQDRYGERAVAQFAAERGEAKPEPAASGLLEVAARLVGGQAAYAGE